MACYGRHFTDESGALAHLKEHHRGIGTVQACKCGSGYRVSQTKPPYTQPVLTQEEQESCFHLTRYVTEKVGLKALRRIGKASGVYACTVCGGYHAR